ncbi:MAG TPA: Ig-like domain-containing protein [Gemmatimonadales bacterium]
MTTQAACATCGAAIEAGARFCASCGTDVSGEQGSVATRQLKPSAGTAEIRALLLERLRDATLGDLEILVELGRGGMATVYLGHDIHLDRKVAVKVMHPALLEGEGMVERFKLEARTAAKLSHPHIIPIFAVRDADQLLYFVMKFVEGRPLDSIIKEIGKLPIPMVQSILSKVGEALGYAHRHGVIHRDIKPANIMIDVEGLPVVTDFGIAKVADKQGLTMTGATVGTPTYMSPEQCTAGTITGATDQYSLGVVAYEMLTGRLPFQGETIVSLMYKHCHEPPPPFQEMRPDCPPALHDAVMRMLRKAPDERFPSMEAAVAEIGTVALGFDDPVRTQLISLAKQGENLTILKRVSTPTSQTPLGTRAKRTAVPRSVTSAPTVIERANLPPERRRSPVVAAAGGALAVAAVALVLWLKPWAGAAPAGSAMPTADPGAPGTLPAARLTVEPATAQLVVGGTMQLGATIRAADGSGKPAGDARWSSTNPSVASVSPAGLVTALAAGATTIRVTTATGEAAAELQVAAAAAAPSPGGGPAPVVVASVRLESAPGVLRVGETTTLRATVLDRAGRPVAGRDVTWSSNDRSRATVSAAGVVTALAPGVVRITALSDGASILHTLEIEPARVASVTVSPPPGEIPVGGSARLTATLHAGDGRALADRAMVWRSANPGVATVQDGLVVGVAPGSSVISAGSDGIEGSVPVTVATPAAAARPTSVDPREAVGAVIQEYARALESRDITEVRRVYPGIPANQEAQVAQTLRSLDNLKVTLTVQRLEIREDVARADVSGQYNFFSRDNRRNENLPVRLQMVLELRGGGWRIQSIQ